MIYSINENVLLISSVEMDKNCCHIVNFNCLVLFYISYRKNLPSRHVCGNFVIYNVIMNSELFQGICYLPFFVYLFAVQFTMPVFMWHLHQILTLLVLIHFLSSEWLLLFCCYHAILSLASFVDHGNVLSGIFLSFWTG